MCSSHGDMQNLGGRSCPEKDGWTTARAVCPGMPVASSGSILCSPFSEVLLNVFYKLGAVSVAGEIEFSLWGKWTHQQLQQHVASFLCTLRWLQDKIQSVDHGYKSLCAPSPACPSHMVTQPQ